MFVFSVEVGTYGDVPIDGRLPDVSGTVAACCQNEILVGVETYGVDGARMAVILEETASCVDAPDASVVVFCCNLNRKNMFLVFFLSMTIF